MTLRREIIRACRGQLMTYAEIASKLDTNTKTVNDAVYNMRKAGFLFTVDSSQFQHRVMYVGGKSPYQGIYREVHAVLSSDSPSVPWSIDELAEAARITTEQVKNAIITLRRKGYVVNAISNGNNDFSYKLIEGNDND